MDWSLLACGASGHVTYEPDDARLKDRLGAPTAHGPAWRCLRCGAYTGGAPTATGPVADAPRVRRGKELRSAFILRLFAIERFLRAIVFGFLAYGLWRFTLTKSSAEQAFNHELPLLAPLLRQLGVDVQHSKLIGLIQHAFTLTPRTLTYLAIGAAVYAAIEIVEGVGLWLVKRWGEYFAMIATSAGLPYEVYDLTAKVTALRLIAFLINLALVVYLVVSKRLFGVRGGAGAYEAALRGASILQEELAALAGEDSLAAPAAPGPDPQERAGAPAAPSLAAEE